MKGSLLLAEFATAHQDGTVSLLRSGITHLWGATLPIEFQGMMVARIFPDIGDQGPHTFDLKVLDEDGVTLAPPVAGHFDVAKAGGTSNFILGMNMTFTKFGRFLFVLRVDNVQCDTWTLTTKKPISAPPPVADAGTPPPEKP